jgi:hypothetical protein
MVEAGIIKREKLGLGFRGSLKPWNGEIRVRGSEAFGLCALPASVTFVVG